MRKGAMGVVHSGRPGPKVWALAGDAGKSSARRINREEIARGFLAEDLILSASVRDAEGTLYTGAVNADAGMKWRRCAAILAAALMMAWPAFYNGYPLLYPDSMTYLEDGRVVARAVFLHQLSGYYGMRSFLYSMAILPLHQNVTPWPVVAFQALLTAWVLWLVVRSLLRRNTEAYYLALVAALSIGTSLSWYASLVMPDILGPVLYLCAFLLVFARGSLSPWERVGLLAIAWWGAASHFTHMILAAGLCILLAPGRIVWRRMANWDWQERVRGLGEVAAMVALAAVAQLALHGYLYGKPSLDGERPPFLTARVIADGPGGGIWNSTAAR